MGIVHRPLSIDLCGKIKLSPTARNARGAGVKAHRNENQGRVKLCVWLPLTLFISGDLLTIDRYNIQVYSYVLYYVNLYLSARERAGLFV